MSFNQNKNKKNKTQKKYDTSKTKTPKTNHPKYYETYFSNTKFIPTTQIINYIKKYYKDYIYLEPDAFFDFNVINRTDAERSFSFDSPINKNSDMSLDKLIAYSFYTKFNKDVFTNENYLKTLKNQMGKDISRGDRTINGIFYNGNEYFGQDKSNYQKADMFYNLLISFFQSNGGNIDYDTINKIALLSCQNMYNFITDLLTIQLSEILKPETNSVFRASKSEYIMIHPDKKTMELTFKSELIISSDIEKGKYMDPEYPCGNLEFVLLFDFTNNTFQFTTFKLDFDLDKCGPDVNRIEPEVDRIEEVNNTRNKVDLKYAVPLTLGVGALVATPFMLGLLGGKRRKSRKTRRRSRRRTGKTRKSLQ